MLQGTGSAGVPPASTSGGFRPAAASRRPPRAGRGRKPGDPATMTHDEAGRRTYRQLPSGMVTYYGHDDASRQTSILNVKSDNTPLSAAYYEFDGDGLPTVQARRGDYDVNHYYTYDDAPRNHLSRWERSTRSCATRRVRDATRQAGWRGWTALTPALSQREREERFTYDEDGNTTAMECPAGGDAGPEGTTEYEWNQDNLIVAATVPGIETANAFEWNAAQQRTRKTDSGGDVWFVRDGQKIVAERTSGGGSRARYANEGPSLYSALLSDRRGGATRWPLFDMLGTVHSFAASNETLSGSALRDAFGPELASTGSLPGPFGYVGALGYYHDPDLTLPLLSIRHYAPKRGLFISRDSVLTEPRYAYAYSHPTRSVDPSGSGEGLYTLLPRIQEQQMEWWDAMVAWVRRTYGFDWWIDRLQAAYDAIVSYDYYNTLKTLMIGYGTGCVGVHLAAELLGGSLFQLWGRFTGAVCFIPCWCQDWVCGSAWTIGEAKWMSPGGAIGANVSASIAHVFIYRDYCSGYGTVLPADPFNVGLDVNVSSGPLGAATAHITPAGFLDWDLWAAGAGASIGGSFGGVTPIRGLAHYWDCLGLWP